MIQRINKGTKLPSNTMIATWDVISLFTNIKHIEGLKAMEEKLETRSSNRVPTNCIVKLMEVVLNNNIYEFHDGLWKQRIGAAMGSRPVPKYVNVFMAKMDDKIKDIAKEYENDNSEGLKVLKRFLDDFFLLLLETTKQLHKIV